MMAQEIAQKMEYEVDHEMECVVDQEKTKSTRIDSDTEWRDLSTTKLLRLKTTLFTDGTLSKTFLLKNTLLKKDGKWWLKKRTTRWIVCWSTQNIFKYPKKSPKGQKQDQRVDQTKD